MAENSKIQPTEARRRANRNWYQRQKAKGFCVRGCGVKVEGRSYCIECQKAKNKKYQYKQKVQRLSGIIKLQKKVIQQLRERLNECVCSVHNRGEVRKLSRMESTDRGERRPTISI